MVPNSPANSPTSDPTDPADLARHVRDAEGWIDRVRSFRLGVELKTTVSPEAIEFCSRRSDRASCCGGGLPRQGTEKLEVAFDDCRAYRRVDDPDRSDAFRVRFWDGSRAIEYDQLGRIHDHTFKRPGPQFMSELFGHLPWPRAAPHAFWFDDPKHRADESSFGHPKTFAGVGTERFRGVDCHVIDSPVAWRRLFVGIADRRLYGISTRARSRSTGDRGARMLLDLAKEHGKTITSVEDYGPWFLTLSADAQEQVQLEYARRLEPLSLRYVDSWFADYQEIAPGCWLPLRMGLAAWEIEADTPFVSWQRDVTVLDARVDFPLPDELFVMPDVPTK
jgi:hypothetical protein